MLKSSGAMGLATMASRVLGMVREILYASFMGAGAVAGAFTMAFMIPNLFRRLLGEGALTAAFIPIFKEKERLAGEKEMWEAANAVISGLIVASTVIIGVVLLILSLLLVSDAPPANLAPPPLDDPLAALQVDPPAARPGFLRVDWMTEDTRLMLRLARTMFPYMMGVCLAAVFMGILNSRGHFFIPAMGAAVINGVLIVTVLFFAPRYGAELETQVFALAYGVLIAGIAQVLYQWPFMRREGFRFQWRAPWGNPTVQTVVRKMIPGMMGVAAFQLNVLITQGIAWTVSGEIVGAFGYAVRLMELPQGVFGISLATFLLPTLAGLAADKKYPEFRSTLGQGIGYLVFTNLIATVLLMVLAEPIIRLLFQRGEFDVSDGHRTAMAVFFLAPGLIAFSLVNVLARAFYALGDTRTPMLISSFCLAVNVVLTFMLIHPLREGGLGLANSISASMNVGLLVYGLRRKLKFLDFSLLRQSAASLAGAALVAGYLAWLTSRYWESQIGHASFVQKFGAVFVPMAIAALIYWLVLLWMKVPQARDFLDLVWRRLRR